MGKKLICFPFVDGDLQEYSFRNLDDSEREKVYNGEVVEIEACSGRKEVWKANEEIELTLHYDGYGRGRSAVTFYWRDDNGHGSIVTSMDRCTVFNERRDILSLQSALCFHY